MWLQDESPGRWEACDLGEQLREWLALQTGDKGGVLRKGGAQGFMVPGSGAA